MKTHGGEEDLCGGDGESERETEEEKGEICWSRDSVVLP